MEQLKIDFDGDMVDFGFGDAGFNDDEEDDDKEVKSCFEVIVECSNESEMEEVFNRLQEEGLKCRISTL
jgi:predicted 3-demethylubiquinone-9 3-methyltransferase (glyoxalase superfamily)